VPDAFYAAIGHAVLGAFVLRVDRLERLAAAARRLARRGAFAPDAALATLAGVAPDELTALLPALGYRAVVEAGGVTFVARPRRRGRKRRPDPHTATRRPAGED